MTAATSFLTQTDKALAIPPLTHAEAGQLAAAELDRVLALVASLEGDDWTQPTDCTAWTVREMVAHLAGACAAYTSWGEFMRQFLLNSYMMKALIPVDGINRRQVEDRADRTPAELVAELREVGPKAVRNRQRIPGLMRSLPIVPFGPPVGNKPVGYLTDNIYTRDWWMHRADICRATGRTMTLTPEHDGRIVELVLRDLALERQIAGDHTTIDLVLTGPVNLEVRFGDGTEPTATITMDFVEFNRLASDRLTAADALGMVTMHGATGAAQQFIENCSIPY